ncbi:MAG: ATP-grasp domain-containing protein [Polyangiaceae bacterium]|nr:ATP-grasp domain-containing protein [Polyangiaceae bacterium]
METNEKTVLIIASYEKGHDFVRTCKDLGWRVVLVTSESLKNEHSWPTEAIDELFFMHDVDKKWDPIETCKAVSYLARTRVFDRIVPLDDFDLEIAAMLREHLRIPGMGETTTRYFRDKLAMRMRAETVGLRVPDFVHLLNDAKIRAFTDRVPAPWVVKPRSSAGAIGIKKAHSREELEQIIDRLGDERGGFLLERYVPGEVFHVDSLVHDGKILFQRASRYGRPPLDVSHGGDVFTSRIMPAGTDDSRALIEMNAQVLAGMRLVRGSSHTEFIRGRNDGQLYFLETSARVGGAHIADMIEAATGLNPWREWAKIELAGETGSYELPRVRDEYAGLIVSLARQEHPDYGAFHEPEVVWRLHKKHHVGLIVRSPSPARVDDLLANYVETVRRDFHAFAPPQEKPVD